MKNVFIALIAIFVLQLFSTKLVAQSPEALAVYYGWPLTVNGSNYNQNKIVDAFDDYNMVVFGGGLIDNLSGSDKTLFKNVVTALKAKQVKFFGYITLSPNTYAQNSAIETRVDAWKNMGVNGIFLDEAGYDFNTTRTRQNDIVSYIHGKNLPVMMNAWNPDDVFGGSPAPKLGTHTTIKDYYMLESFMIGSYTSRGFADFGKTDDATGARYQKAYTAKKASSNLGIVTLTTTNSTAFLDCQFNNAWWATFAYGFNAMGWGEVNFSAGTAALDMENQLPYRTRPSFNATLSGDVSVNDNAISRNHNKGGSIVVNPQSHHINYTENGSSKFKIDNLEEDCGGTNVFVIPQSDMAGRCVPQSLGSAQFGIYVRTGIQHPANSSVNGGTYISECECYTQVTGSGNMSIVKNGGRWTFLFAPDCIWKGEGSADIGAAATCEADNDLECLDKK